MILGVVHKGRPRLGGRGFQESGQSVTTYTGVMGGQNEFGRPLFY